MHSHHLFDLGMHLLHVSMVHMSQFRNEPLEHLFFIVYFYKVHKDFSEINTEYKICVADLKNQHKILKLIEGETFEEKMGNMNINHKK
jgi:hypothetical protein